MQKSFRYFIAATATNAISAITLCSLLYVNLAFATQTKMLEDGDEFTAEISKSEINRIKVLGDRIRNVQNIEGELNISRDDKLGEIYIRATSSAENKPINFFITTEQNFTYKGLLIPRSIPAEQILIKNDNVVASSDNDTAKITKNSYQSNIIALLKAMRLKQKLDGYQITQQKSRVDLGDLTLRKISTYKGQNFIGEIFTLKNSTNQMLNLDEKLFFKNGVRAIKIDKDILLPNEITEILVVS